MAETFLAVRRGPGGFEQHVCVKRILPALEADPQFVESFMQEARLAAQLRHANITQVVDFGQVDGAHYLALELVDGTDLRALLREVEEQGRTLDARFVAHIGLEVASALHFAHTPTDRRPAVIHRDVSPSNILVSRHGQVYLTDFGIARALGASRQTESGVVRGKVPYMAPEYAIHGHYDALIDVFSLGVVLFEALAGARPFDGASDLETVRRLRDGERAPLDALCNAPEPFVHAVERAIATDATERFGSAAGLRDALGRCINTVGVEPELGALVASFARSLSEEVSLSISLPSRTAILGVDAAPSYPSPDASSPDTPTRTSERSEQPLNPLWDTTDPQRLEDYQPSTSGAWKTTDPARLIAADRSAGEQPQIPETRNRLPTADRLGIGIAPRPRSRRAMWFVLAIVGALVFAGASVGAYAIVTALRTGGL